MVQNGFYFFRYIFEEFLINLYFDWLMVIIFFNKCVNIIMLCDKKIDMCQEFNWLRGIYFFFKLYGL